MGIVKKIVKAIDDYADRKIAEVVQKPTDPPTWPKPPAAPPKSPFRLFAPLAVALVLTAGCEYPVEGTPAPAPTTVATCDEDQPWCWDCSAEDDRDCGPIEVQR